MCASVCTSVCLSVCVCVYVCVGISQTEMGFITFYTDGLHHESFWCSFDKKYKLLQVTWQVC